MLEEKSLELLFRPVETVTPEMFGTWRRHPCTIQLKQELISSFVKQVDEIIPDNHPNPIACMFLREGAKDVISQILDWEPIAIRDARNRGVEVPNE